MMAAHGKLYLLAVVLVTCSFVEALKWKDCGSKDGKIVTVTIPGCENANPCPLKHGTNQSVSITFTTGVQVTSLSAKVHGQIGPVSVPFPLQFPDACQHSNLTCPLAASAQYVYATAIYVDPVYPTIHVVVKWELIDQTGADTVCFQVPVEIISARVSKNEIPKFRPISV